MTILGEHTLAETNDLVKNYDNLFQGMSKSAASVSITDPTWQVDYDKLLANYNNGKSLIPSALPFISANVQTCEQAYQAIVHAVENVQQTLGAAIASNLVYTIPFFASFAPSYEGQTLVGSAQDLFNRLSIMVNAQNAAPIVENTVQPTAPDSDLQALTVTEKITKTLESTAQNPLTWIALGAGAALAGMTLLVTAKKIYL